jgi:hypothetical protein
MDVSQKRMPSRMSELRNLDIAPFFYVMEPKIFDATLRLLNRFFYFVLVSSVGALSRLRLDDRGTEFDTEHGEVNYFPFCLPPEMYLGSFPGGWAVNLATHLYAVLRLGIRASVPLRPHMP